MQPPEFPQPVLTEPSALKIMDTIQGFMEAWTDVLRRVNLEVLATEFVDLSFEEKLDLDHKMLAIKPEYRLQLQTMAQDVRPYRVWERCRETYEPHPSMSQELVKMKSDTLVPGEVFQRLRHPNPLFLLPGAPPVTLPEGSPGRIVAILITGAVARRHQAERDNAWVDEDAPGNASVLLDTHDPNANAYHATVLSEVHNEAGTQVVDLDWCHLTIPIRNKFTLDNLARGIAADGFNWTIPREAGEDGRYQYLLTVARATVSHLLYACSRTVEIDDKPRASRPPVKRKKGAPKAPSSARIRRMGWRIGAAIADSIRRAPTVGAPGPGTGKKIKAHMRGAHLHLFRVGPGRQEIDVQWLDPIPVNMKLDDGKTITSHPMR